jgi:hypothetical protein
MGIQMTIGDPKQSWVEIHKMNTIGNQQPVNPAMGDKSICAERDQAPSPKTGQYNSPQFEQPVQVYLVR